MTVFRSHYHCNDCNRSWRGTWDCICDDQCPYCGHDTKPVSSDYRGNRSRVIRAELAIERHSTDCSEPFEDPLTDLLTDLRHLAADRGVEFDVCDRRAKAHFLAEQVEQTG